MAAVAPADGAVVVPLLAMETSSMFMMAKGITAVTFYRGLGRDDALAALRPKALALLAANPWLAGRLVRDAASKTPVLSHPPSEEVGDAQLEAFLVASDAPISSGDTYPTLARAVAESGAELPAASKRVGKPEPVGRLTVATDPHTGGFALAFSLCHAVADGHTFYTLLGMLSAPAEVKAMSAERRLEFEPAIETAQGKAEHGWGFSNALLCHLCAALSCWKHAAGQPHALAYLVDSAKVAEVKAGATNGVDFVSTNDILTVKHDRLPTSFLAALRCR